MVLLLARRFALPVAASGLPSLRGTVLAIALSLVPLVLVLEVSDGMIQGITSRFIELGTYHLQVALPPESSLDVAAAARETAATVPGVTGAYVERRGTALLAAGGRRFVATVRALETPGLQDDPGFRRYLEVAEGAFEMGTGQVVLGRAAALALQVGAGDQVALLTTTLRDGRATPPRISWLTIAGIFSTGYQELDRSWVFVSDATARQLFRPADTSLFVGVKVADPFAPLDATRALLRQAVNAPTYTWFELEQANFQSFQSTRAMLTFIMALIVCVAAVNVSAALVMVGLERQPELAYLTALGASAWVLSGSFLLAGFFTGVAGAVLGISFGLLLAVNINEVIAGLEGLLSLAATALGETGGVTLLERSFYLERIPVTVDPVLLSVVCGGTVLAATLAAVIPARRAARLQPLQVLRRL